MDEFENVAIREIYISRYIASWLKTGVPIRRGGLFSGWLKSLGLNDEEINRILYFAENGKLELEHSAKAFLRNRDFN